MSFPSEDSVRRHHSDTEERHMKVTSKRLMTAGIMLIPALFSGCSPFALGLGTPVPVQSWVADTIADRLENKNDHRVPVMPAIPPGHKPMCEDPPDQREILRAMPRVTRGIPYVYEEFRDDVEFTVEKLVDRVDPPRFFPLIGAAQLHHCHWKCTVYYTETLDSSYPFPFRTKRRRSEVVYIDKDHMHLCVSGQDAQRATFNEMSVSRP
jgi:hypothetical protein